MKVAYITFTPFLDSCIERIKLISKEVELSVFIFIAPYSLKSSICNLKIEYNKNKIFYEIDEVFDNGELNLFNEYFSNCKSVQFVMMPPKSISISAYKRISTFKKYLKQLKPDIIQMQEAAIYFWSMYIYLKKNIFIMSIHDPIRHTGEKSLRSILIRKLLFNTVDKFELYSNYSKTEFINIYGNK